MPNNSNHDNIVEENEELIAMKRRMTLVTAEENIPSDDEQPPDILYGPEGEMGEYSEEDDVPLDDNHEIIIEEIESDDHCETMTFDQMEALYKPKQTTESLKMSEPVEQVPTSSKIQPAIKKSVTPTESTVQQPEKSKTTTLDEEELISEEDYEYSDDEVYDNDVEEEDDDISDVDDRDLMKRLEEKYGKLPSRPEADIEEEDDDIDPTWTSKS